MNHEDLLQLRDNVAYPAMKRLFESTVIPEGFCCINDLSISYIDGRSWGVDSEIKAAGLIYKNGSVEKYEFTETDLSFSQFADLHKNCVFAMDGKLQMSNELEELQLSTVIRSFDICARICPELEDYIHLNRISVSSEQGIQFEKMKYLFAGDDYLSLGQAVESQSGTGDKPFIFDDELCIQDDNVTLDGYLWATDALVDRMKETVKDQHTQVQIDSFDNINFYAEYNLKTGSIEVTGTYYYFDANGENQGAFTIALSEEEKASLPKIMESYCQKVYGESFADILQNLQHKVQESVIDTANLSEMEESTWILVYKDTLGCLDDHDNLTEIRVPTKWLLDALKAEGISPDTWFNEYTADDTDDIARNAIEEGVILECSDKSIQIPQPSHKKLPLDCKISSAEAKSGHNRTCESHNKTFEH